MIEDLISSKTMNYKGMLLKYTPLSKEHGKGLIRTEEESLLYLDMWDQAVQEMGKSINQYDWIEGEFFIHQYIDKQGSKITVNKTRKANRVYLNEVSINGMITNTRNTRGIREDNELCFSLATESPQLTYVYIDKSKKPYLVKGKIVNVTGEYMDVCDTKHKHLKAHSIYWKDSLN